MGERGLAVGERGLAILLDSGVHCRYSTAYGSIDQFALKGQSHYYGMDKLIMQCLTILFIAAAQHVQLYMAAACGSTFWAAAGI